MAKKKRNPQRPTPSQRGNNSAARKTGPAPSLKPGKLDQRDVSTVASALAKNPTIPIALLKPTTDSKTTRSGTSLPETVADEAEIVEESASPSSEEPATEPFDSAETEDVGPTLEEPATTLAVAEIPESHGELDSKCDSPAESQPTEVEESSATPEEAESATGAAESVLADSEPATVPEDEPAPDSDARTLQPQAEASVDSSGPAQLIAVAEQRPGPVLVSAAAEQSAYSARSVGFPNPSPVARVSNEASATPHRPGAGGKAERRVAVLDAPSNLGLRPPTPYTVPGCAKAPGALRDHQLLARLSAHDAGCLTPPRFDCSEWQPGDGVGQADSIADYTVRLANRVRELWTGGYFPVVLGGDCSILLGNALACKQASVEHDTSIGLAFIDAHSDFRHPGNSKFVGAAAAEDLALVTGRGQPDLTDIDGLRPYFEAENVVTLGLRADDSHRVELSASGIGVRTVPQMRSEGTPRSAEWGLERLNPLDGFWIHLDTDVLDPSVMPAVDGPTPGGISHGELQQMLAGLVNHPKCVGMDVTVFDPDYDPQGTYAGELVDTMVNSLAEGRLSAVVPREI